jgi:hypothetical protein
MIRLLVFLVCIASQALAEKPWPKRVGEGKFVETVSSALPKALRGELASWDEFVQGGEKLPESLEVCRIDLNGDGADEFIVMSRQSYSGGPMMYIFERRKDRYVFIGDEGGRIYFGPLFNGYLQIVSQSRAGGGVLTRVLDRFQDGKYHTVRIADYREREVGDELDFIRERDPK